MTEEPKQSEYGSCGEPGHFESTFSYRRKAQNDCHKKLEDRPRRSEWRLSDNEEMKRRGGQLLGIEQRQVEKGRCHHLHNTPSQSSVDRHHRKC